MKICKKCIMDETAQEILFDEKGICNFCRIWEKIEAERLKEKPNLSKIIERIKKAGQGKKYDVLIGLSGGVDSSLTLHYLCELGLKPLTYQVDNGWNTLKADENVMRLVEALKFPFYRYVIDVDKFKELQAAFIKSRTANIEIPTDHILFATTYEMANKYGIKYVISGGNHATEGIMPKSWGYDPTDLYFIKSVYKIFTGKKLTEIPMLSLLKYNYYLHIKGIKIINLLDYFEYNREKAKKLLREKYGWKDYGDKHCESIFTEWFQKYYLPNFFGIDKRKAHYSSLINSNQMTREEALRRLGEPLKYMGNSKIKKSYQDYPNSEKVRNLIKWFFRKWKLLKKKMTFLPA